MPLVFLFTDPATTEIYTLSLHDALPICEGLLPEQEALLLRFLEAISPDPAPELDYRALYRTYESPIRDPVGGDAAQDRKSTRLNSSHVSISYAVFCLKKKKKTTTIIILQ